MPSAELFMRERPTVCFPFFVSVPTSAEASRLPPSARHCRNHFLAREIPFRRRAFIYNGAGPDSISSGCQSSSYISPLRDRPFPSFYSRAENTSIGLTFTFLTLFNQTAPIDPFPSGKGRKHISSLVKKHPIFFFFLSSHRNPAFLLFPDAGTAGKPFPMGGRSAASPSYFMEPFLSITGGERFSL